MCYGTQCTPTYANSFMGLFEENYVYHLIKEKCKLYLRYIDDMFPLWTATLDEFNKFIAKINKVHPSIKFDFNYSKKCEFLRENCKKNLLQVNFPPVI